MKLKSIFVAMLATVALLFVGCTKDLELAQTKWHADTSADITDLVMEEMEDSEDYAIFQQLLGMMGGKFVFDGDIDMNFTSATQGVFSMKFQLAGLDKLPSEIRGLVAEAFGGLFEDMVTDFTYTFEDNQGVVDLDGDKLNMNYDKKTKELTLTPVDSDLQEEFYEMFGTSSFVFKQV